MRDRRWLLAAPLVSFLAIFLAYPTAYAVKLAFTDTVAGRFPSLASFRALIPPGFRVTRVEGVPFRWLPIRYVLRCQAVD